MSVFVSLSGSALNATYILLNKKAGNVTSSIKQLYYVFLLSVVVETTTDAERSCPLFFVGWSIVMKK